jgi:hypothetical protein
MRLVLMVSMIPASGNETVVLTGVWLAPCHFGGGGSTPTRGTIGFCGAVVQLAECPALTRDYLSSRLSRPTRTNFTNPQYHTIA